MIWSLIVLLFLIWIVGYGPLAITSSFLHLLLVIVIILALLQLFYWGPRAGGPPPP